MGRRSKMNRQHDRRGYIPAKDFREVHDWIHKAIIAVVTSYGGDGIEGGEVPGELARHDPPNGWGLLDAQKRSSQFWRAVRRLSDKKMIEEYHSNAQWSERSRVRLRLANVLDRLTHALGEEA